MLFRWGRYVLKLYGGAMSRATLVRWYLEELQVPYEFVLLDMRAGEHLQPTFLAINPFGKVPAIVDGDLVLWESGAILLYLSRRYGPPLDPAAEAVQAQWILFANATLGPEVFVEARREQAMPRLVGGLDALLANQPFVAGDQFSAADVAVGSILFYIPLMLKVDLSPYARVSAYLARLGARPAFQKTMALRSAAQPA